MCPLQKQHENRLQRWLTNAVLFRRVFSCTPPFTTPATYLALREMSKVVHPSYLHTKEGMPPHCYKHNISMALSFCKSTSEKFADRPVFKCAVRVAKNPFTNREDSSFVKCIDTHSLET